MRQELPDNETECSAKCCSGHGNSEGKSDQERVREVADTFFNLARNERDGHYHGMLKGLQAASFLAGDDELLTHINQKMDQLKADKTG